MKTILVALILMISPAFAAQVELRIVNPAGNQFPARNGKPMKLEAPLLAIHISSVSARGSRVELVIADAAELEQATASNLGKQLAIVVDGVIQSAPTIKEAIHGGRLWVTLRSPRNAQALAQALTAK